MAQCIRFHENGSPDVLKLEMVDLPPPGPGEARVRHSAVGVNFIDTYHRTGLYKMPLPSGIGKEAAGLVEAVGEGVTSVKAGDRVAVFAPNTIETFEVQFAAWRLGAVFVPLNWRLAVPELRATSDSLHR